MGPNNWKEFKYNSPIGSNKDSKKTTEDFSIVEY
jgi:hypothetical protein